MKLHFLGGADTVTGSMHMVEVNGARVLRDAGLFQGRREESRVMNRNPGVDPATLDALILSHAHIDHCGNLPTLCAMGYQHPVHATRATTKIAAIMLRDSAFIQMQDSAYLNQKTSRKGKPAIEPLYTPQDAESAIKLLRGHDYRNPFSPAPGITVEDFDAGHILGASLSYMTLQEGSKSCRLGFAVDLGRHHLPLIRDPEQMPPVDVLVMESTYGNRLHGKAENAREQLRDVIERTWKRGGKVLIPAFALERAQELVYHISSLMLEGRIARHKIYIDSPMAAAVTKVFDEHVEYLDDEYHEIRRDMGCLMCPPWIQATASVEESKRVTSSTEPCAVIAASGMCEHGRILHHLKHGIEDARNTIAIVGYQADHTLGRRLVEQQRDVKIFGDLFERQAEVAVLDSFSAHADRNDLIDYAAKSGAQTIYLVHGEQEPRAALADALRKQLGVKVGLPSRGDIVELPG